jgi:hypothetical protein
MTAQRSDLGSVRTAMFAVGSLSGHEPDRVTGYRANR